MRKWNPIVAPRTLLNGFSLGTALLSVSTGVSFLLLLSLALLGNTEMIAPGQAAQELAIAGLRVAMWKPPTPPPAAGYPLILYSHGFTNCSTRSSFLASALADAGYLVLAPNHRDAGCGELGEIIAKITHRRQKALFWRPGVWNEATFRDRKADLEAILNLVIAERSAAGVPVDPHRIGLTGHSLGGYAALGLAGAWPSWKDPRVKAILCLSPYALPFATRGNLANLDVPVMFQGGTQDTELTPYVSRPGGVYDRTSAPKYYVEFAGAGHYAWTDATRSFAAPIDAYSVAFFDRYLKGATGPDPLAKLLYQPWPPTVSNLKYALPPSQSPVAKSGAERSSKGR